MTSAVWIDPNEIRLFQRRGVKPSRFLALGRHLNDAAKKIPKVWNTLSSEERSELKKLAYDLIEPRQGLASFPLKIWALAYIIFIRITRQEKAFLYCIDALDYLIDSILDAVEQESSLHRQMLSDTLERVVKNPEIGEPIDGGNRSE